MAFEDAKKKEKKKSKSNKIYDQQKRINFV